MRAQKLHRDTFHFWHVFIYYHDQIHAFSYISLIILYVLLCMFYYLNLIRSFHERLWLYYQLGFVYLWQDKVSISGLCLPFQQLKNSIMAASFANTYICAIESQTSLGKYSLVSIIKHKLNHSFSKIVLVIIVCKMAPRCLRK